MNITLAHLSDLHFKSDTENPCSNLTDQIAAAIHSRKIGDIILIAVTGDIAFSGRDKEYELAKDFFEDLQIKINEKTDIFPLLVIVPGNHDCDFSISDQNRELLLSNISNSKIKKESYDLCNSIQKEFESFRSSVCPEAEISIDGIGYTIASFAFGEKTIVFRQHNSAWMSQKNEKSNISLPVTTLPPKDAQMLLDSDLSIGLMHHTFSWLDPECSRNLTTDLQATCDLILTGHEHEAGGYLRLDHNSSATEFLEGGVLQSHNMPCSSDFSVITIDTDIEEIEVYKFTLDNRIYRSSKSLKRPFIRNVRKLRQQFSFSEEMIKKLNDIEVGYRHPYKEELFLEDLFVYPECQKISLPGSKSSYKPILEASANIFEKAPFLYLAGPEKSGKTTVAKKVIKDLHLQGVIPVLAKGKDFKKSDELAIKDLIIGLVKQQYSEDAVEPYRQLTKAEKIIIIDDYHMTKVKGKGRDQLIKNLKEHFSRILLIGHNDSRWDELYQAAHSRDETYTPVILSFDHYELVELGPVKRSDLVKKWLTAGGSIDIDPEELHRKSINAEDIISRTIGINLIPAYPLFILMLIQQLENKETSTTAHGAQGYLYESLITMSLMKTSKYAAELDIKYKYLSELAFLLFDGVDHEISRDDLMTWHTLHCKKNLIKLDFEKLIEELVGARILDKKDSEIVFVYPYIRYYFTARHIRDNVHLEKYQDLILKLTNDLHRQEASNILMFISYLCKDPFVLNTLLDAANNLFKELDLFDFSTPPEFLSNRQGQSPKLVLEPINHPQARREELKRIEAGQRVRGENSLEDSNSDSTGEQIDTVNLITSATKTIQILGQILRSYPGSLQPDDKIRITEECYHLGLRITEFCINFLDKHGVEISEKLISITTDLHPESSKEVLAKEANVFLIGLCSNIAFGMLKHVSGSVGLEELSPVFEKILEDNNHISNRIIDLSIKLDHHKNFPKKDSIALYGETKDTIFTSDIIRNMVWYHMRMFPVPYAVSQSVCKQLDIELKPYDVVIAGRLIEQKR